MSSRKMFSVQQVISSRRMAAIRQKMCAENWLPKMLSESNHVRSTKYTKLALVRFWLACCCPGKETNDDQPNFTLTTFMPSARTLAQLRRSLICFYPLRIIYQRSSHERRDCYRR
jgi:hypothetical protein